MGTDVYLKWDGMSEDEEYQQLSAYSIRSGQHGYLRATYVMELENSVLCLLFPVRAWKSDRAVLYDFVSRAESLPGVVSVYLENAGVDNAQCSSARKDEGKAGDDGGNAAVVLCDCEQQMCSAGMRVADKKAWARSLSNFFELGARLQREGRRPRVYISW